MTIRHKLATQTARKQTKKVAAASINGQAGLLKKHQAVLAALERNNGNVSAACKAANIGRRTFYLWRKDVVGFTQGEEMVREGLIDMVEDKLLEMVRAKNITAIIWWLKCNARHRGYAESPLTVHVPRSLGTFKPGVDDPEEYIRKALEAPAA